MNKSLSQSQIAHLRESGILSSQEIAFFSGDLLVAENVVSQERRIINEGKSLLTESKRILKG